jgi:hypothetical protein
MFYKYCKHHDIDTIDYPEKFYIETSFTKIKGVKYGPYKSIRCIECKRETWNKMEIKKCRKRKSKTQK